MGAVDGGLVALLVGLLGLAALCFYLGFVTRDDLFDFLPKASFLVLTFLLIPLVCVVLVSQATAPARLAELGLARAPGLRAPVGIATGLGDGSFVFDLEEADPRNLLAFYEAPQHREGWEVASRGWSLLVLRRGTERMLISVHDGGPEPYAVFARRVD